MQGTLPARRLFWYNLIMITFWPKLFSDINRGYKEIMNYRKIDELTKRVLWWHFAVFVFFSLANSYFKLSTYIQSPFSLRVISANEAAILVLVAACATFIPQFIQKRNTSHYLYRICVTVSFVTYSALFVFITGGAIEAYFHFFLAMMYLTLYADWRLAWVAAALALFYYAMAYKFYADLTLYSVQNSTAAFLSFLAYSIPVMLSVLFMGVISFKHKSALLEQIALETRKDNFISMASHELKTPLTSLKVFTSVLSKKLEAGSIEDARRYLAKVENQTSKLTTLVLELLDLSRIQTGKMKFNKEDFNLDVLIDETVEAIKDTTNRHAFVILGKLDRLVYADRYRVYQVLLNLLTNAVKYSDGGKIIVRTEIDTLHKKVIVSIKDYGIGIDPAHQDKIFQRLYQGGSNPAEKTYPGLGIGLFVSHEIVRQHGGHIWVKSKKGRGSTFSFSLPV